MQTLALSRSRNILRYGAVAIIAIAWLLVPSANTFFFSILVIWIAFRLDSRIVAGSALAFLFVIPLLLFWNQSARAEQFAVYVFLLLCITVALQVVEFMRAPPAKTPERRLIGQDVRPRHTPYAIRWERARIDGIIPRHLLYGS